MNRNEVKIIQQRKKKELVLPFSFSFFFFLIVCLASHIDCRHISEDDRENSPSCNRHDLVKEAVFPSSYDPNRGPESKPIYCIDFVALVQGIKLLVKGIVSHQCGLLHNQ